MEVTGIGDDWEIVSVIFEVVALQVEILFVVIAVSGFSRCKKGTIEFFFGLQVEHIVLFPRADTRQLFQLAFLIVHFYFAD